MASDRQNIWILTIENHCTQQTFGNIYWIYCTFARRAQMRFHRLPLSISIVDELKRDNMAVPCFRVSSALNSLKRVIPSRGFTNSATSPFLAGIYRLLERLSLPQPSRAQRSRRPANNPGLGVEPVRFSRYLPDWRRFGRKHSFFRLQQRGVATRAPGRRGWY